VRFTQILAAAVLVVVICAYGQDVHYNYDLGANFAAYKTYQWVDLFDRVPDQFIDRDIKRSVDEQLAQKGLTKVGKDADLQIGYHAAIREERSIDLVGSGWGGGGYGGWRQGSVQGQTSTIPVGMLLVDIYDPATKQLIWRGDASKTIDLNKDPDKNYRNLQKAMAKLFKNYPPHDGK
jgi:Domain of unknown function (DUF4136)